jgi:raffinose/stachyose/melibiose transport system substrate-binding protein
MKKWISSSLVLLLVSVFVLAACSDSSSNDKEGKSSATITFGTHQSGIPRSGIMQEMAKDFEAETGIKIDFQVVPDAQWRDLLKAKLATGEAPDIFNIDVDPLSMPAQVRPEENAIDLTDEEFTGRMSQDILPSVSYKDKVYGVSFAPRKIWYIYYNKAIFNDLGLVPPTNYADFKAAAQAIKDSGVIPLWQAPGSGWYQVLPLFEVGPLYQESDPDVYEKLNNNEIKVKDLTMLETVITQQKEFADLGFFGENFMSNTVEAGIQAFGQGKAAMIYRVPGSEKEISDEYPEMDGNMGFFVMPWGDNQTIGINPGGSGAMFGNSKSDNQEEILEFFRWITKHDNIQRYFDNMDGNLTTSWPEVESKLTAEYIEYENSLKSGTVMQAAVKYIDPQWMDIGKDLQGMFAGQLTPQDILDIIDKRRAEQAKVQQDSAWE